MTTRGGRPMQRITATLSDLRSLCGRVARDFAAWPTYGPRMIDEMECVLSVLLAIVFARALGAQHVGWAAFSGYMVMRSHVAESVKRGSLRVIGTAAGATAAWLLAAHVVLTPLLLSVALALIGGITLYLALVSPRGYAWIFTGITFSMVLLDAMGQSGDALGSFAWSRFIEVFTGTCACVLVSAISTVTLRRKLTAAATLGPKLAASAAQRPELTDPRHQEVSHQETQSQEAPHQDAPSAGAQKVSRLHKAAFRHALQAAVALCLVPWVASWLNIESLVQASVTIIAVMIVPLASLTGSLRPTRSKLLHRFIGCVFGGVLATGVLLASHDFPFLVMLAVCAGVVVGRHIENGQLGVGYIGTQFTLALLVVLVPDAYSNVDIASGIDRLFGIAFGMLLLEPVRILFHQFWPRGATRLAERASP
jgi:uncharacterized membrane protein YccC